MLVVKFKLICSAEFRDLVVTILAFCYILQVLSDYDMELTKGGKHDFILDVSCFRDFVKLNINEFGMCLV